MTDTEQLDGLYHDLESLVYNTDYSEALSDFQHIIAEGEAESFATETASNGEAWSLLAESTIRRKGHDQILVESFALLNSLVGVGNEGNISEVDSHGSIYGTSVPYAIFHDQGTSRMPARPPVGVSEDRVDQLAEMVAQRTIEAIGGL